METLVETKTEWATLGGSVTSSWTTTALSALDKDGIPYVISGTDGNVKKWNAKSKTWDQVGQPNLGGPNGATGPTIRFDSNNTPYILLPINGDNYSYSPVVMKLVDGNWVDLKLNTDHPVQTSYPYLRLDGDIPVVAYALDAPFPQSGYVVVKKYDPTSGKWLLLGSGTEFKAANVLPQIDHNGTIWNAYRPSSDNTAGRLTYWDTTTNKWVSVTMGYQNAPVSFTFLGNDPIWAIRNSIARLKNGAWDRYPDIQTGADGYGGVLDVTIYKGEVYVLYTVAVETSPNCHKYQLYASKYSETNAKWEPVGDKIFDTVSNVGTIRITATGLVIVTATKNDKDHFSWVKTFQLDQQS